MSTFPLPLYHHVRWRDFSSLPSQSLSFFRTSVSDKDKDKKESNTPVIFLHGLFGSKNNFKSIASHIARTTGHPCFGVDLRNHGDSPHASFSENEIPAIEMARDLALFLTNIVKVNLEKREIFLVGHSLGGRVALQFADLHVSSSSE